MSAWARFWVVMISALLILLYLWLDVRRMASYERYILVNAGALLWIPSLIILLGFGQSLGDYGLTQGDIRLGRKLTPWLSLAMVPLLFLASRMSDFQRYYPVYRHYSIFDRPYASDLIYLLYFEMTYGFYLFCWEFFFRGYLLNGLRLKIGWWAVVAQAIPFGLMHYGKPMPEMFLSFIGGCILGWVAWQCRSMLPCFGIHWFISALLDIFVLQARGWRV